MVLQNHIVVSVRGNEREVEQAHSLLCVHFEFAKKSLGSTSLKKVVRPSSDAPCYYDYEVPPANYALIEQIKGILKNYQIADPGALAEIEQQLASLGLECASLGFVRSLTRL